MDALEQLPAADGRLVARYVEAVRAMTDATSADEIEAAQEGLARCLLESAAGLGAGRLLQLAASLAIRSDEGETAQSVLASLEQSMRTEVRTRAAELDRVSTNRLP